MRDEGGYASILVLGMALIAIAVAGVAIDGTRAFLLRRSLQNAADAAALAAASEIDRDGYYASGGRSIAIDPDAARAQVANWLAQRGLPTEAAVAADEAAVQVTLRAELDTTFLRVIGIESVPVAVESLASPVAGAP
jgi:Flp pilus assembly protein TadG